MKTKEESTTKNYTEEEVIAMLNEFGNHILFSMRLHDIGGTLKKDKARIWFNVLHAKN